MISQWEAEGSPVKVGLVAWSLGVDECSMDDGDISTRLISLIAEISPATELEPGESTRLIQDLMFDSISLLELAVAIESEFDLSALTEMGTANIVTVGDLVALVRLKCGGPQ